MKLKLFFSCLVFSVCQASFAGGSGDGVASYALTAIGTLLTRIERNN